MKYIFLWMLFFFSTTVFPASIDYERQSVTIALTQEPPNLNSLQTVDLVSFFVLGHVTEGLVRYDRRGRLVPGIATDWVQKDRTIRFNLHAGASPSGSRIATCSRGWPPKGCDRPGGNPLTFQTP